MRRSSGSVTGQVYPARILLHLNDRCHLQMQGIQQELTSHRSRWDSRPSRAAVAVLLAQTPERGSLRSRAILLSVRLRSSE